VKPDWRLEDLFVVEQHQAALASDQIPRRPVAGTVRTSEDAQNAFDRITRSKAAAVLRMIKHAVTEANFREPLAIYLQKFKYGPASVYLVSTPSCASISRVNRLTTCRYGAASADDLWAVFENYYFDNGYQLIAGPTEVPFTDFVRSFMDQPGYPVVHVTKTPREFRVSQVRRARAEAAERRS